jgi:hypothetical protein
MATTTTNFGWDIPQSTDLVKDGATAIAALGQDIDTAMVDLKGGTTGQVLAKASGTDLDFSWVAQDDSNAIQNAIVDAKGDLIGATAADTPARLAVGTNGQVLTADSTAATGLAWATPATPSSGLTLISTTTLSGSGAFNLSGIFSSTYDDYIIEIDELVGSAASYNSFGLRTGSTNSTSGYNNTRFQYTYANANQANGTSGGAQMEYLQWGSTNATAGGATIKLKGPFLAKATQVNFAVMADTYANQSAGQHAVATSYDSMWFGAPDSGTLSGKIRVYGMAK